MLKMSSLKNPLMKDISDKNVEQLVQSGEIFHEILINSKQILISRKF